MKSMKATAVIALAALSIAACGSGEGTAPAASSSTATASTTTAVPTTDDGAETRAAASFIARHRGEIDETVAGLKECPSIDDIRMLTCSIRIQTATLRGKILARDMRNFEHPPIGETASLWSDTIKDADALGDVDISKCEADAKKSDWSAGNCATDMYATSSAAEDLAATLDGWSAYAG
ncbi:MAG: hypothetical protein HOW59_37105 [Nonomuraea sp.]|nr:hypothetical protein [Nonomuraea sp.]NUQ33267.1 hypothetical protein [Dermatophilaceae bacterium]NUR81085.1 hypothetical protein [Dermatophilaceae bacterium]